MGKNEITSKKNSIGGIYGSINNFEDGMKVADLITQSDFVPSNFQGEENLSNAVILVDMASRLQMSPIMVAQNLYIVNGMPSWSSKFVIAMINSSQRYSIPLQFEIKGSAEAQDLSCYCWTKDHEGNIIKGTTITLDMAKAEGWYGRKGSKWKTMPEQMIRYRAASFFGNMHCSDLLMGYYTTEEVEDTPELAEEYVESVVSEADDLLSEDEAMLVEVTMLFKNIAQKSIDDKDKELESEIKALAKEFNSLMKKYGYDKVQDVDMSDGDFFTDLSAIYDKLTSL